VKENFATSLQFVQNDEGGGSLRPEEPGGAVFHGISLAAYSAFCKRKGRFAPKADDLFRMTEEDEREIYKEDYWDKVDGDDLPAPLDYVMFNAAVMEGVTGAKELWLQARSPDIKEGIDAMILLHLAKKMRRPSVGKFGVGWSDRLMRVWRRARAIL
jgi:lysozyme family protein